MKGDKNQHIKSPIKMKTQKDAVKTNVKFQSASRCLVGATTKKKASFLAPSGRGLHCSKKQKPRDELKERTAGSRLFFAPFPLAAVVPVT